MPDIVTIPFFDFAAFTETITLEDTQYILSFTWNSRGEFWVMSIQDLAQNEIVSGIKLILDLELLRKFPDRSLPPGKMYVFDVSGNTDPIKYDDFTNGRCDLVYENLI